MILQLEQSSLTFFSKLGRSCDSQRAVLASGSSRAIDSPLPLLEPPPLLLFLSLLPHAATASPANTTPIASTSPRSIPLLLLMWPLLWGRSIGSAARRVRRCRAAPRAPRDRRRRSPRRRRRWGWRGAGRTPVGVRARRRRPCGRWSRRRRFPRG